MLQQLQRESRYDRCRASRLAPVAAAVLLISVAAEADATRGRSWLSSEGATDHHVACDPACTRRGNCDALLGRCECPLGWTGPACEDAAAPECVFNNQTEFLGMLARKPSWQLPHAVMYGPRSCRCIAQLVAFLNITVSTPGFLCLDLPPRQQQPAALEELLQAPQEPWAAATWKLAVFSSASAYQLKPVPEDLRPRLSRLAPMESCRAAGGVCHPALGQWCEYTGELASSSSGVRCVRWCARGVREQCELAGFPCHGCRHGRCDNLGFCKCRPGFWGIDCTHRLYHDPTHGQKAVVENKWRTMEANITAATAAIRYYVYPVPPHFRLHYEATRGFMKGMLNGPHRTADPAQAQFFYVLHSIYMGEALGIAMFHWLAATFPYLHRAAAAGWPSHMVSYPWEHGPLDSFWQRPLEATRLQRAGALPAFIPPHPDRITIHLQLSGVGFLQSKGRSEGRYSCLVACFKRGTDLVLPPEQGDIDGPLFKYSRSQLLQHSPWKPGGFLQPSAHRNFTLFFAGWMDAKRGMYDFSGRAQLLPLQDDPQYLVHPSNKKSISVPEAAGNSWFCYSPLGKFSGDPRRYLGAVLHGCIPVHFSGTALNDSLSLPFDELPSMDWARFSLFVSSRDLRAGRLREMIESLGIPQRRTMQQYMIDNRVWERLLYTQLYGPLLGEDGSRSVYWSTMELLAQRWRNFANQSAFMPPAP